MLTTQSCASPAVTSCRTCLSKKPKLATQRTFVVSASTKKVQEQIQLIAHAARRLAIVHMALDPLVLRVQTTATRGALNAIRVDI